MTTYLSIEDVLLRGTVFSIIRQKVSVVRIMQVLPWAESKDQSSYLRRASDIISCQEPDLVLRRRSHHRCDDRLLFSSLLLLGKLVVVTDQMRVHDIFIT